jgi:hypothetical protein
MPIRVPTSRLQVSRFADVASVMQALRCVVWSGWALAILSRRSPIEQLESLMEGAAAVPLRDDKVVRPLKAILTRARGWEARAQKFLAPGGLRKTQPELWLWENNSRNRGGGGGGCGGCGGGIGCGGCGGGGGGSSGGSKKAKGGGGGALTQAACARTMSKLKALKAYEVPKLLAMAKECSKIPLLMPKVRGAPVCRQ